MCIIKTILVLYTSILLKHLVICCMNYVTETDSPYMSPDPKSRNDPSTVTRGIAAIAKVKGLSTEQTADIVMNNFYRLFGNIC